MKSRGQQYIEDNILDVKYLDPAMKGLEMERQDHEKRMKLLIDKIDTLENDKNV